MKALWRGLSGILLCALLVLGPGGAGATTPSATAAGPEAVAHDFYVWYLNELKAGRDPVSGERRALARYVAPALLAEIDRKIKSPDGMEADYFIQAQDYLDAWLAHVAVRSTGIKGGQATAVVTLGETPQDVWRLRVTLQRDARAAWRIRRVVKD